MHVCCSFEQIAMERTEKIKYLVADTTAFINAVPLNEYANNVITVPDVVAEVRNKRQIRRLCVLPFDLQVREPRPESVQHCVEFAKKTGDYASLSGIDMKVIALTYELESDILGTKHLRIEPVVARVVASKDKPIEFQDNTRLPGWYNRSSDDSDDHDDYVEDGEDGEDGGPNEKDEQDNGEVEEVLSIPETKINDEITEEQLNELFKRSSFRENDDSCDLLIPQHQKEESENSDSTQDSDAEDIDDEGEGEGEGGWITPANIKKAKKSLEAEIEADFIPEVACMSTDFAVQNVLMQMSLHVAALNGRIIKHLRTYILRCYACFKTTSIMTKVFCPNCGNKTLKRVAISLDENGKQVIHINTRKPLTRKYKNQSLPRFQGGKHSRNPILFEDQPIPRQMPSRVAKTKTNALDEDYIAGFSPFVMRDVDSKSAMLRSKGNIKEWARNNTFEEDRRRKHYNRLYK